MPHILYDTEDGGVLAILEDDAPQTTANEEPTCGLLDVQTAQDERLGQVGQGARPASPPSSRRHPDGAGPVIASR